MSGTRTVAVRRFAVAFVCVAVITIVAAWLHREGDNDSTASPSSTANTSPPSTGDNATPVSSTTEGIDVSGALAPLPVPDLTAFCVRHFGGSYEVVPHDGNIADLRCATSASSEPAESIDVAEQCRVQFGESAQPVRTDDLTTPWRCTASDTVDLGPPDYDALCDRQWGAASSATQLADDVDGWRCAVVQNGVFALETFAPDDACQATYGTESYGRASSKASDAMRCYGRLR